MTNQARNLENKKYFDDFIEFAKTDEGKQVLHKAAEKYLNDKSSEPSWKEEIKTFAKQFGIPMIRIAVIYFITSSLDIYDPEIFEGFEEVFSEDGFNNVSENFISNFSENEIGIENLFAEDNIIGELVESLEEIPIFSDEYAFDIDIDQATFNINLSEEMKDIDIS